MKIRIDLPYCTKVDAVAKANAVQFEELTSFDNKIIDSFRTVEDLNKFRLNLYNLYKAKVKIQFVKVGECMDEEGNVKNQEGFKLSSDIFHLSDNDIGRCLPFYVVKEYFRWSNLQHRYINRENLHLFDYI